LKIKESINVKEMKINGTTIFIWGAVVSFGPRSAIERLFGDIECRIRRFWNGFVGKYSRESMERWVMSFSGFRNLMKNPKGVLS
jgi:hypothetical protein